MSEWMLVFSAALVGSVAAIFLVNYMAPWK